MDPQDAGISGRHRNACESAVPVIDSPPAADAGIVSVLAAPQWVGVFMALSMALSLVPFAAGFVTGLTVSNTSVFGTYALISGVMADAVIRWKLKKTLVVFRSPRVPFVALWILLCAYVIVFKPF
jgi:hypothetical protein